MATKKAAGNGVRAGRGRTRLARPGCTGGGGAGVVGSSVTTAISPARSATSSPREGRPPPIRRLEGRLGPTSTDITSAGGPAAAGKGKEPLPDRGDHAPQAEAYPPASGDAPEHRRARQGSGCDREQPPHDGPGHPGDDPEGLPDRTQDVRYHPAGCIDRRLGGS